MSQLKVNTIRHTSASSDAITLASDGTATAKITNNLSNRNKVINGSVMINQRGNATGVNSSGYYGPDRFKWVQNSSSAAVSINKSTESPDGFANSYHIDCTTADTSVAADSYLRFLTVLEGQDVQDFAKGTSSAKKAVLSFYVKTDKTGTYSVLYFDSDNNRQYNATYTVSNTNWNRYTIAIPADTTGAFTNDNGASLEIYWHLVAGSNITSGSLDTTWNSYTANKEAAGHNVNFADSTDNDFYITGIQLEVDSTGSGVATDFEHRSYTDELARCQRYYFSAARGDNVPFANGNMYNGNQMYGFIRFPTEMRANPTLKASTGTYTVHGGGSSDGCDDASQARVSKTGFVISISGNLSLTAGVGTYVRTNDASGYVEFDAEL